MGRLLDGLSIRMDRSLQENGWWESVRSVYRVPCQRTTPSGCIWTPPVRRKANRLSASAAPGSVASA